jgi:hypothetical protein
MPRNVEVQRRGPEQQIATYQKENIIRKILTIKNSTE